MRRREDKQGCHECGRIGKHEDGCRMDLAAGLIERSDEHLERAKRVASQIGVHPAMLAICDPKPLKATEDVLGAKEVPRMVNKRSQETSE